MGDNGRVRTSSDKEPSPMPRLAIYALVICVLALVAAVLSFVQGNWLGILWILVVGLSSNMCWYYVRKGRAERVNG